MASPDYFLPSSSDYDDPNYYIGSPDPPSHVSLINSKLMIIAIVILFCLILLFSTLHIFCKWAWGSTHNRLNSSRFLFINQNQAHFAAHHSGLSKDAIAQLPIFTYKLPAAAGASSNDLEAAGHESPSASALECAVCLNEFQENEKGRLLPSCNHSFHIECIDMWFYSHSTCPLCRAEISPTIITCNSPLMTNSTQEGEGLLLQGAQDAIEGPTFIPDERNCLSNSMAIPAGNNVANTLQIPTNTLFHGDSIQTIPAQVGSSHSLEKPLQPPSSSRSTRSMPHITIEIPTMQDINLTSPACISLSSWSSRCASPHDQTAYSSCKTLKSPGLRESVKRMLSIQSSKEKRALPSSSQEGNMDSPKACS